jgi:hypothetical protein
MNHMLSSRPVCTFSSLTLALTLLCALAAPPLSAADTKKAAASSAPPSTKLVVPPEWKIPDEPRDYIFEGLPLSEVVLVLQDKCKHEFDALIPRTVEAPRPAGAGLNAAGAPAEPIDAGAIDIKLRLKNVTIPEVFQAMNMLFELERTPVRWELTMNGHRPVAMLRPVDTMPPPGGSPEKGTDPAVSRSVVYVGNLLDPQVAGAPRPEVLAEILEQTTKEAFPNSSTRKIQFHRDAQLVVLTGTDQEVRFMKEVLEALTEKSKYKQGGATTSPPKPAGKN